MLDVTDRAVDGGPRKLLNKINNSLLYKWTETFCVPVVFFGRL